MTTKELDFESMSAREIGELLNIPLSTLRFYISGYSNFLSSAAIRERNRRFNMEDLIILATIHSCWQQRNAANDIDTEIGKFKALTTKDKFNEGLLLLNQLLSELQEKFDNKHNSLNKQISRLKRLIEDH